MKCKYILLSAVAWVMCLAGASMATAGGVTVFEDGDKKLTIGGKAFINYTYGNSEKTVGGTTTDNPDSTGLAVDRFYLTTKYYANKTWMGRITMDVNNEQDHSALKRRMNVFLKYAYIEGNFMPEARVRIGLSHTPWIDYEQHLWKHRYVSKVASDHFKFDDSADYGLGLKGKLADGMVQYWLVAVNGGGYSKPNKSEGVDINGRLTLEPVKGLHVSGQYRNGYRGTNTGAGVGDRSEFYQAMLTYGMKGVGIDDWRIGANYLDNSKTKYGATTSIDDQLYTVWGWGKMGDFGAFGRYDHNKNEDVATSATADVKTDHVVVGVETWPVKGLTLSAAWDYTKVKNLAFTSGDESKSNKVGLYSQYKF
ncbi:MAG: hypothetical protein R8K46_10205 [Mariprofundaceae bacterium]